MFSARTRWNFTRNALTQALDAHRAAGHALLDLTESNPTRVGLGLAPGDAFLPLAAPPVARYEPDPRGLGVAREAVCAYYRSRSIAMTPERVILTASTSEAYGWLFKLLCDPGDDVLVAHPSYPLFDDLARLEHVTLRPFPLAYEGRWSLDIDALRARITPRTRAVLLVHPNNPTGSFLRADELAALVDVCRAHDLALVCDEVFGDYAYAPDARRVESLADVTDVLTFTLSGLSKVVAMPQMKLGWIAVSGPAPQRHEAVERLEFIADCYLSVGAPVQHAASSFLARREAIQGGVLQRVRGNREVLRAKLGANSRATLLHAEGGWYATLQVARTRSEEEWVIALLERDHVLVQPGFFFDFAREAFLVLSLLPEPEVFAEGIARFVARVEED